MNPHEPLNIRDFFEEKFTSESIRKLSVDFTPFSYARDCWHVYGDLRLNNELEAPTDSRKAEQLLRVLEQYVQAAEAAISIPEVSGYIIEVQGTRIHAIIPDESASYLKPLAFAKGLHDAVYSEIRRTAGDNFQSFAAAADFGDAILVRSRFHEVLSEVSLGDVANAPAKRLGLTPIVDAHHLAMRTLSKPPQAKSQGVPGWHETDLEKVLLPEQQKQLAEKVTKRFVEFSRETTFRESFDIQSGLNLYTEARAYLPEARPVQTFGFCMRADLSGFTAKVKDAQESGVAAMAQLAQEFSSIMKQGERYIENFGKPITPLPWAGDCSVLIFPASTLASYKNEKKVTPVRASVDWSNQVKEGQFFTEQDDSVSWAIGIGGGEHTPAPNSNGNVLIVELQGQRRPFPIAIGPGVKRALDAEQADGLNGNETAMLKHDVSELKEELQEPFQDLVNAKNKTSTLFDKVSQSSLEKALSGKKKKVVAAIATSEATKSNRLPASEPYHNGQR